MSDHKLFILGLIILAIVIVILILLVYHIFVTPIPPPPPANSTTTHPTKLTINHISDVTAGTNISISGELIDLQTGQGIEGQQITFSGSGVTSMTPSVVTTQGITLENPSGLEVLSCDPASCTTTSGQSHVVKVTQGLAISFPPGANGVTLLLSGTQNNFVVTVTQYDDVVYTQSGNSLPPDVAAFSIVTNGNASIKKIEFKQIDGPSGLLLSEIRTFNTLNQPQNISQVDFEQVPLSAASATGTTNSLPLNGGSFSSSETTNTVPSTNTLEITAHFAGNSMFAPSDSDVQTYQTSLDSTSGVGGLESSTPDSGKGFTRLLCSSGDVDTDRDGLCDQWETPGQGIPYVVGTNTFNFPIDSSITQKNIFVQIDSMDGSWPNSGNAAISDITNLFNQHNIILSTALVHNSIPAQNTLAVWTDSDNIIGNDFDSIKAKWFGSENVRSQLDASSIQNNCVICSGTTKTITVSGIKFWTPNLPVGGNPDGATSGTITIKQTITFSGSGVTVTTPIANPVSPPPNTVANTLPFGPSTVHITWGTITAAISPGTLSPTQTLTLTIPFTTDGPIPSGANAPSIGTITTNLVTSSGTVTGVGTGANSPTITSTLMNVYSQVWRYALWANCIGSNCASSPSGIAEQGGSQGGNDLIVALSNNPAFNTNENTEAGTFMHELGHTLGLRHGGTGKILSTGVYPTDSGINCKPNYISIMNYPRQMATYLGQSWALNYSSGVFSNSQLVENNLSESNGLVTNPGVSAAPIIIYGIPSASGGGRSIVSGISIIPNTSNPGIDWNGITGITQTPPNPAITADIDNLGIPGCTTQTENVQLKDYDDWSNLFYNFTNTGTFDGVEGDPKFVSEVTPTIFNAFKVYVYNETNVPSVQNNGTYHGIFGAMPMGP